eukprot:TRINITY_DN4793_c0_g1_i2.p1 TRINITY_DN4793_c0_g1~~TRINITY_DN4793_c0_g1_i2.p1  ORF type:complete len:154 (+),score=10.99 TRINITY_DN4793_c0_g1_i2:170-631(+)
MLHCYAIQYSPAPCRAVSNPQSPALDHLKLPRHPLRPLRTSIEGGKRWPLEGIATRQIADIRAITRALPRCAVLGQPRALVLPAHSPVYNRTLLMRTPSLCRPSSRSLHPSGSNPRARLHSRRTSGTTSQSSLRMSGSQTGELLGISNESQTL